MVKYCNVSKINNQRYILLFGTIMGKGVYTRHRENQRALILETAEELFIQIGIDKVTVSDISRAARITKPTIYKYFEGKAEIATEIFKGIAKGWIERNAREAWNTDGTGFEIIERFFISHFNHLFSNLREARFVAEFNHLYARELPASKANELFVANLEGDEKQLKKAILDGFEDGSIRSDIKAEQLEVYIFNFISALMNRLGEFGVKLDAEYEMEAGTAFTGSYRIFLDGLKPSAK